MSYPLPPDVPRLDPEPPRTKRRGPVSPLLTAAVLASAFAAVVCGGALVARMTHRSAGHAEWFAPPTSTDRGFARLEQTEHRP